MIPTSFAPVRIDFAGGWSDVPDFADRESGRVVNAAISRGVWTELRPTTGRYRLEGRDIGAVVESSDPDRLAYDGSLDLHKAVLRHFDVDRPVHLWSASDVPMGSGLGGSATLAVALTSTVAAHRGLAPAPGEIAELAFSLEAELLGMKGGKQDQYASAFGGFNDLTFAAGRVTQRTVAMSAERIADLRAHVAIVHTAETRVSSDAHERVWRRFHAGDPAVIRSLREIRDLVDPTVSALEAGDWPTLAACIDRTWTHQRSLDPALTSPGLERAERIARDHGAWGIKATGAAGGGCMIVVGPPAALGEATPALLDAGQDVLDWRFSAAGVTTDSAPPPPGR